MKEIDEKLANEMRELIGNAESYAAKSYKENKNNDSAGEWLTISCMLFDARQHLEWHMFRHENTEGD